MVIDHESEFLARHNLVRPYCGCSFGPGWTKLLDELVVDLKALGWDGDVHQIKEKFGGLRFYVGAASDAVRDRINLAEDESFKACEECGAPGERRSGGWIKTLCDAHAAGRAPRESPKSLVDAVSKPDGRVSIRGGRIVYG